MTLAEGPLHKGVERRKKVRVQSAPELRRRVLPAEGNSDGVGTGSRKVIDLGERRGDEVARPAVDVDAKVKPSEVDAAEFGKGGRDERGRGKGADEQFGDGHVGRGGFG